MLKHRIKSNINWIKNSLNPIMSWLDTLNESQTNYRLPSSLKPSFYQLEIQPFIIETPFTFNGKCLIKYSCVEPTNEIIFHSNLLFIDEDKLELHSVDDSDIKINKHTIIYDSRRHFVSIKTNKNCTKNAEYSLLIIYTGLLSYKLNGFYISSYIDKKSNLE